MSSYGSWCRRVIGLLAERVSYDDLTEILDQTALRVDYDAGLSAERAAELRFTRMR